MCSRAGAWTSVHVLICSRSWNTGVGEKCEKKMRVSQRGYAFTGSNTGIKHTDPIKRSYVNHNNTDYVYIYKDFPSKPGFFFLLSFFYILVLGQHIENINT